jgi:shikimate kinase
MKNIILTGMAGVGKTTIGRSLAQELNFTHIDLDKIIEDVCGVSIQTIFEIEGEYKFRQRETKCLEEVLTTNNKFILSLGGGTILTDYNRELIKKCSINVIYLYADIDTLVRRVSKSLNKRPLFNNVTNIKQKVADSYDERHQFYQEVSTTILDTTKLNLSQIIEQISINYHQNIL